MTNEELIRTYNTERLAYFLKECMFNDFKPPCKRSIFFTAEIPPECFSMNCVKCIIDWLRSDINE